MAEQIPGARLVKIPGDTHGYSPDDPQDAVIFEALHQFMTGERPEPRIDRGRLDVVPHEPANPVDLSPGAHVVVALLSTPSFNAAAVASASARFGATGTEAAPTASAKLDVNGDGRKDLRLRFATGQTGIQCGQSSAELSAQDPGSKKTFYEADAVSPPPC